MRIVLLLFLMVSSAACAAVDDANTISLLHFNDASGSSTITDESGLVWVNANSGINNGSSPKFGACALQINNNLSQFLQSEYSNTIQLATGDFTIDLWCHPYSINFSNGLFGQQGAVNILLLRYETVGGALRMSDGTISSLTTPVGSWSHVAYTRSSGVERLFINGVKCAETTPGKNYDGGYFNIGADWPTNPPSSDCFNGLIDEFRISTVARWTADFTPPAAEYAPMPAYAWVGLAGDGRLFFAENGKYLLGVQP